MKFIQNKILPLPGFGLMNILGLVFTRVPISEISEKTKTHEAIHTPQQYELLTISAIISLVLCNIFASWWYLPLTFAFPFIIYILSFIAELVIPPYHNLKLGIEVGDSFKVKIKKFGKMIYKIWHDAYRDNCFEREARANQDNPKYLVTRPICAWIFYIIPFEERKE